MFRTYCWTTPRFAALGCAVVPQVLTLAITSAVALSVGGLPAALAAGYGAAVAAAAAAYLFWNAGRAEPAADNAMQQLRDLYRSGARRFVLVAALLGAGLTVLHLAPGSLIAGFAAGQLSYVISHFLRAA